MTRPARIGTRVGVGAVALVIGVIVAANIASDRMWFSALGFGGVYDREESAKVLLFVAFGAVMGVLVAANVGLAFASRPVLVGGPEIDSLSRSRAFLAPIHRRSLVGVGLVVALASGRFAADQTHTLLMWRYGGSFGVKDPYFHRDAGFYVFELPWWHFVTDFAMAGLVLALVAALVVHYLYGGLRLQPADRHLTRAAGLHLAGLGAAILVLKGIQAWLGRFDLVTRPGDLFTGMSYVGYHSMLPGQTLLAWLALVCAVLLLIAAWRTEWMLSTIAIGLYALAILGVGVIWPASMRSASVEGHEVTAERSFVTESIEATRAAYGLGDVSVSRPSMRTPNAAEVAASPLASHLRTDAQRMSTSLGLLSRAEIGSYVVNGTPTQVLVGVKRSAGKDLLEAAFANEAGATKAKTAQTWWSAAQLAKYLQVRQQPLLIDPAQNGYMLVPSSGPEATNGTSMGSWWARAASAVRYADPGLLGAAGSSRLADLRQPLQRVQQLAPWLTLDSQVYPAVVQGRVVWILDGYTTSDRYPGSQATSLAAATADSQNPRPTFGSTSGDVVNYLRDAVKVVVDAQSGAVTFYAWDESDPILKAMRLAYPGLIQPKLAIPGSLAAVMRYPSTLFAVQRAVLAAYHVPDPTTFLKRADPWQVAGDPDRPGEAAPAVRDVILDRAGAVVPGISSTYVDSSGAITEGYLSVNDDIGSTDFGRLELQMLPRTSATAGPTVVQKRFNADPRVVALRAKVKGLHAGALLTVPVGGGILQAQTLYGSNVQPGQAKAYVATFGEAIGYGHTLAAAIADIAVSRPAVPANTSAVSVELVRQADRLLASANAALAKHDLAAYQADVAKAKALLERALRNPAWKAGQ